MEITTISSKYQVVIPRTIREQFGLKPGQRVMFIPYKGTLRMVVVPPIEQARGMFAGVDTTAIREEEDDERG
jgi:AbrB family looped-hinge helix DNA binding protein